MDDARVTTDSQPRRRRRWPLVTALVLLAGLVVAVSGLWVMQSHLVGQVTHLPEALPTNDDRPTRAPNTPEEARTILLLGSDKRADGSIAGERSDTIMIVRVAADRDSVAVVSIPRDSWVDIPGHGNNKINAAFSFGGPGLAVQTIESMSGVRIDHVAVIDWEGFKRLTDALGGVTVTVPETTFDAYRNRTWKAGTHHLDGEEALTYVRQRAGLPGGDLDRVKRQQNVIRSLMVQTLTAETLTNPLTLYKVLDAVTENLEVDEEFGPGEMRSLAISLRSLRSSDVKFTTIPVAGTGMVGSQSVVHLDDKNARIMWEAFADDEVAGWIEEMNRGLGDSVR